jgi:hypothetical protein
MNIWAKLGVAAFVVYAIWEIPHHPAEAGITLGFVGLVLLTLVPKRGGS